MTIFILHGRKTGRYANEPDDHDRKRDISFREFSIYLKEVQWEIIDLWWALTRLRFLMFWFTGAFDALTQRGKKKAWL